jgi:hypothetical protein
MQTAIFIALSSQLSALSLQLLVSRLSAGRNPAAELEAGS